MIQSYIMYMYHNAFQGKVGMGRELLKKYDTNDPKSFKRLRDVGPCNNPHSSSSVKLMSLF